MAFLYRSLPFFTAQKPLIFRAERAAFTAATHGFFLAKRLLFLLTTRPCLFFVKCLAVNPPTVFSLVPRSTRTFANFPRAVLLTTFFFMALMAFIAAIAFIAFAIFCKSVAVGRKTKST